MKAWVHHIIEPPKPGVLTHRRSFLSIWRGKETHVGREFFGGHLEAILKRPTPEFSARFHVGTAASETPFDGHLTVLGSGIYWGLNIGHKVAERITRESRHKYEGRELKLYVYEGTLWWALWVHDSTWERGEFAKWRESSLALNPADHLYGSPKYSYEDIDTGHFTIVMPEGHYPIAATLQKQRWGRPRSRTRDVSWVVKVEAPQGIPDRYDSSGGWKGDRVYGFAVTLRGTPRDDWQVDALNAITARIYQNRANFGFRRAQEQPT